MVPNPVRLFHITAMDNLSGIFEKGMLLSKNAGALTGIDYQNIAHASIQTKRAVKLVPNPPGGNIHDYVPFYFAPRSPMLFAIHNGNVDGCSLGQEEIVHLEATVDKVIENNDDFVFYDRNAAMNISVPFTDLAMLQTQIAWDLITESPQLDGFCKYFQTKLDNEKYVDRMERRQAEFLVKHQVSLSAITKIGVVNNSKLEIVSKIMENSSLNLPVEVKANWYF
jgi:ssDNA thymidine ADP-ribosyltransferase, DarT